MKKVFVYVHTHWDREWYREFEEFRLRLIEVVDDIINKLESDEIPSFYFDGQTSALEDYLEIYPNKKETIEKLIKQKKLFIGPFYCSADSFLTGTEFLIRNLKIGMEYSQNFGCNHFIGYLSDTFGHSAYMPEILNTCNIEKAMMWRGLGNLPSEFLWKNICVTYLIQGYFQDFFSLDLDFDKKTELLEKYIDKIAERSSENILLPCGADHLKIADNLNQQIAEINSRLKKYELKLSTPFEYLNLVQENNKLPISGEFLDESKNFLLKGVYSTRIYQKQLNAKTQWELSRIAEPASTLCYIHNAGKNRQNELDFAYKKLIKNHAHDSIYGCSTDNVHKDVQRRFKNTLQITNGLKKRVIRDFQEETNELRFLNLSNFNYSGPVEIETEQKLDKKYNAQLISKRKGFTDKKLFDAGQIPVTEDITEIKKYLVEIQDLEPFSISKGVINKKRTLKITQNSIENGYIGIFVENNKIKLVDKIANKKYLDFVKIIDFGDIGDSYNFGAIKNDKPISAEIISSKIKQKGPIKNTLSITFSINIPKNSCLISQKRNKQKIKHKIVLDISLSNLQNFAEFNFNWKNKAKNHKLQARFNLEKPIKKTFSDDLTGLIERKFDPNYDIYEHIPAPKGIELKTNTAPMQNFVWAQGTGIITEGLNEYEVFQNNLSITLLRACALISNPKNPCRGTPAGPPLECADMQCIGACSAKIFVTFTQKPSELYSQSEKTRQPILNIFTTKDYKPPIIIENQNILIQALKLNSKNELIVRLVNVAEKNEKLKLKVSDKFKKIYLTNALEKDIHPYKNDLTIKANEIITLKFKK